MTDITFRGRHGDIHGYLAQPDGTGPWPGVIVIHDVFGMSDDLHRQCQWLASSGYIALAPDLFSWGRKFRCLREIFGDLRARHGRSFDDIDTARRWLVDQPTCTGRVGVIGYCLGGGFSLLLAPGHGFSASSVNYGQVPDDAATVLATACPVIGSFGARDLSLRGAASKLTTALAAAGIEGDVHEYPTAGHGFLNQHGGGVGVLIAVTGRLLGMGYEPEAAAHARRRIVDFFDRHLKEPPEGAT